MQILGRYCVGVSVFSLLELYQRVQRICMEFWVMDVAPSLKFLTQTGYTGFGFSLRGCFSRVLNVLGMLLIFVLCMKILRFRWHSKGFYMNGFCLKNIVVKVCDSKIIHFKYGSLKSSQNPNSLTKNNSTSDKEDVSSCDDTDTSSDVLEDLGDGEREVRNEDKVFDVMTLTKLVKIERQRANAAYAELEKERAASASAADEAMAMILRLQSEKSSIEIEANQFRRMAEKKQEYDQEVIESLQWIVMQNESRISLLDYQLILYREKLKQYMKEDEMDQFERLNDDDDANRTFPVFSVDDDLDGSLN